MCASGHLRLGAHQAHHDLVARHLQGEDHTRQAVLDARRPGQVQAQGRLTDRRTRRDDDQLPRVQPVGQRIQVGEPGGHPDHLPAVGGDRLDLVQGAVEDVAQRGVVLARAPAGQVVHLGLGPIHEVVHVTLGGVPHLHDPRPGRDHPAQHRPLRDDLRVVRGVRRRRHHRHQGVQVRRPPDPGDLPGLGQLPGHHDRVRRLTGRVQVQDRRVHRRVRRAVEVLDLQRLHDVSDGVLAQQHRPEHRCLRRHVRRRRPIERRPSIRDRQLKLSDAHPTPPGHRSTRGVRHRGMMLRNRCPG